MCTFFALPLRSKSIDVVWTSHAVELNAGGERKALTEIFRVAKSSLCLLEPYYEGNSDEGKRRMRHLGYIRALPDAIAELGGVLEDCVRVEHAVNPLNPTYAFVITPPPCMNAESAVQDRDFWACPSTGYPLSFLDGFIYCERSGLAYPILRGIPVLREESAILATALRHPS